MEHLASTPVVADAEAVLFSWTDREGRGYEVLLRGSDRLVAALRFDAQECHAATQELGLQCKALGLAWEAMAPSEDTAWTAAPANAGGAGSHGIFSPGAVRHGH